MICSWAQPSLCMKLSVILLLWHRADECWSCTDAWPGPEIPLHIKMLTWLSTAAPSPAQNKQAPKPKNDHISPTRTGSLCLISLRGSGSCSQPEGAPSSWMLCWLWEVPLLPLCARHVSAATWAMPLSSYSSTKAAPQGMLQTHHTSSCPGLMAKACHKIILFKEERNGPHLLQGRAPAKTLGSTTVNTSETTGYTQRNKASWCDRKWMACICRQTVMPAQRTIQTLAAFVRAG